jgi:hypothetical protein
MENEGLVRILLITDEYKESLLAFPLGRDLYRLDNSPWFAYGVSAEDVVEARAQEPGGALVFVRVVEKSGNRTLRIHLSTPVHSEPEVFQHPTLSYLLRLGCAVEGSSPQYFSVNVPPSVDFDAVCYHLAGSTNQWEYADPSYAQLFPIEAPDRLS